MVVRKPGIAYVFEDSVVLWTPEAYDKMFGEGAADEHENRTKLVLVKRIIRLLRFQAWMKRREWDFEVKG